MSSPNEDRREIASTDEPIQDLFLISEDYIINPHEHKLNTFHTISLIVNRIIGTGIFSTPALIFTLSQQSIGISLILWVLGGIFTFAGLSVYLEFGLKIPKSGGEKNYLSRTLPKPKHLIECIYAFTIVLLGFSSGNSYAFGKYIIYVLGFNSSLSETVIDKASRYIGSLVIISCTLWHIFFPTGAKRVILYLGLVKVLILGVIVFLGSIAIIAPNLIEPHWDNFHNSFSNGSQPLDWYSISVALLQVIYSFKGWENANYVLEELEDPRRTLMIAAPVSVGLTTFLYIAIVFSYYVVIPKAEISDTGILISGVFFERIFERYSKSLAMQIVSRVLPFCIILSNYGNVMAVSFSNARVNQELAKEGIFPLTHLFSKLNYALFLHCFITIVVLLLPPNGNIYQLIIDLYAYPSGWFNLIIGIGLIYIHWTNDGGWNDIYTPWSSWYLVTVIFIISNLFLAVIPFVPPNGSVENDGYSYWVFPVTGISIMGVGALYWLLVVRKSYSRYSSATHNNEVDDYTVR
ncbi:uncharacterized protein KLLA0_F07645g [Kluyveromyces lactis]|uniref:KLLA0F07645p n=1 Tax=Kluyveromyces lactis (strain ATCC 8585 / CBS 2359 / DSM 70799 / NBRC 1267 / NRRL Y-1140 / WM37) TaxID=284590 RepID=Q6CKW3_KLULA|nr:uncharacterized protein KLLA0_F07645g [Kluyveromyces lactis]CAG98134.1 KLLA0F07645p [Kluyveromyces lactis]|eukprot:XP_455426.1 uncharacterized protein KLLA0_F07645g [Kluyveromyces lactis]